MSQTQHVNISGGLGCLAFVLVCLILGGLGFCGDGCQNKIVGGVHKLRGAPVSDAGQ